MKRYKQLSWAVALVATGMVFQGCNLTGGIDSPGSREDKMLDAQAKMDTGDCDEAVKILKDLTPKDDAALHLLGTAYLCSAGATANKVDSALASYSSTTNNLTVVGTLAGKLIGSPADADVKVAAAVENFNQMSGSTKKSLWQVYANVVRVASLMAKNSADKAYVRRSDIAGAACVSAACGTAPAACAAGMPDADAVIAANALLAAATAAGQSSSLGAVATLAQNLNNALGNSVTANAGRCVIVNQTLSN